MDAPAMEKCPHFRSETYWIEGTGIKNPASSLRVIKEWCTHPSSPKPDKNLIGEMHCRGLEGLCPINEDYSHFIASAHSPSLSFRAGLSFHRVPVAGTGVMDFVPKMKEFLPLNFLDKGLLISDIVLIPIPTTTYCMSGPFDV